MRKTSLQLENIDEDENKTKEESPDLVSSNRDSKSNFDGGNRLMLSRSKSVLCLANSSNNTSSYNTFGDKKRNLNQKRYTMAAIYSTKDDSDGKFVPFQLCFRYYQKRLISYRWSP